MGFVIPSVNSKQFMIGRGRDLCRLHWDVQQNEEEKGFKRDHWVVVMAEVDRELPNNRFNDGKCDPKGRLWAGLYRYGSYSAEQSCI